MCTTHQWVSVSATWPHRRGCTSLSACCILRLCAPAVRFVGKGKAKGCLSLFCREWCLAAHSCKHRSLRACLKILGVAGATTEGDCMAVDRSHVPGDFK